MIRTMCGEINSRGQCSRSADFCCLYILSCIVACFLFICDWMTWFYEYNLQATFAISKMPRYIDRPVDVDNKHQLWSLLVKHLLPVNNLPHLSIKPSIKTYYVHLYDVVGACMLSSVLVCCRRCLYRVCTRFSQA